MFASFRVFFLLASPFFLPSSSSSSSTSFNLVKRGNLERGGTLAVGGAGFSLRGKKALGKPSCMIFAASSAAVFGKLIKPRRGEGEIFVVLCEIFWHGKMVQCSRQCF